MKGAGLWLVAVCLLITSCGEPEERANSRVDDIKQKIMQQQSIWKKNGGSIGSLGEVEYVGQSPVDLTDEQALCVELFGKRIACGMSLTSLLSVGFDSSVDDSTMLAEDGEVTVLLNYGSYHNIAEIKLKGVRETQVGDCLVTYVGVGQYGDVSTDASVKIANSLTSRSSTEDVKTALETAYLQQLQTGDLMRYEFRNPAGTSPLECGISFIFDGNQMLYAAVWREG